MADNKSQDFGPYSNLSKYVGDDTGALGGYDMFSREHFSKLRDNMYSSIKDDTKRMVRAFPTFRLSFIEKDSGIIKRFDDFYGYNSVESIQIHKSKDNAADTAVVKLTNFRGRLDDKNFEKDTHAKGAKESKDPKTGKEKQDKIESMYLYPGVRIQILIGYSSTVWELDNVFTGKITEVDMGNGDFITFVAQGYGVELLADKGYDWGYGSSFSWFNADPLNLMNKLIGSPECKNFGRWDLSGLDQSEILGFRMKGKWVRYVGKPQDDNMFLEDEYRRTRPKRFLSFTDKYHIYNTTIWGIFKDMQKRFPGYIVAAVPYDDRATLFFGRPEQLYNWTHGSRNEIIKEQEHQGEIYRPMSSENDGIQFYTETLFDSNDDTVNDAWTSLKKNIDNNKATTEMVDDAWSILDEYTKQARGSNFNSGLYSDDFLELFRTKSKTDPNSLSEYFDIEVTRGPLNRVVTIKPAKDIEEVGNDGRTTVDNNLYLNKSTGKIVTKDEVGRGANLAAAPDLKYKVFRSYHFKDSYHHIIANNIKINLENFHNRIIVRYFDAESERTKGNGGGGAGRKKVTKEKYIDIKADDSIPEEYWRTKVIYHENCFSKKQAQNYALSDLTMCMQKLYDGELVILGDGSIKPYDHIFINDAYSDMYGPIEVREVVHEFSRETGFTTTIIPDLVVHSNSPIGWAHFMFSVIVESALAAMASGYASYHNNEVISKFDPDGTTKQVIIPSVSKTVFPITTFKLGETKTTHREPISISPLMYAGKPYVAGIEGIKHDSLLANFGDRIKRYVDEVGTGVREILGSWAGVVRGED